MYKWYSIFFGLIIEILSMTDKNTDPAREKLEFSAPLWRFSIISSVSRSRLRLFYLPPPWKNKPAFKTETPPEGLKVIISFNAPVIAGAEPVTGTEATHPPTATLYRRLSFPLKFTKLWLRLKCATMQGSGVGFWGVAERQQSSRWFQLKPSKLPFSDGSKERKGLTRRIGFGTNPQRIADRLLWYFSRLRFWVIRLYVITENVLYKCILFETFSRRENRSGVRFSDNPTAHTQILHIVCPGLMKSIYTLEIIVRWPFRR